MQGEREAGERSYFFFVTLGVRHEGRAEREKKKNEGGKHEKRTIFFTVTLGKCERGAGGGS